MKGFKSDNLHITENAMNYITKKLDDSGNGIVTQSSFVFDNGNTATISRYINGIGKIKYNLYCNGNTIITSAEAISVSVKLLELSWKNE